MSKKERCCNYSSKKRVP